MRTTLVTSDSSKIRGKEMQTSFRGGSVRKHHIFKYSLGLSAWLMKWEKKGHVRLHLHEKWKKNLQIKKYGPVTHRVNETVAVKFDFPDFPLAGERALSDRMWRHLSLEHTVCTTFAGSNFCDFIFAFFFTIRNKNVPAEKNSRMSLSAKIYSTVEIIYKHRLSHVR